MVDAADKVITILEDCGTSLDKLLPFKGHKIKDYNFTLRLAIAAHITNEMFLLKQTGMVHRDLKPANICLKKLPNNKFQIIFIDFGLSEDANSINNWDFAGTISYMPPELFTGGKNSYESDIFTLSIIFGQLFGATNIFKYKIEASKKASFGNKEVASAKAPLCFDGLNKLYNETKKLKETLEKFSGFVRNITTGDKFKKSNSSGIKQIFKILQAKTSPLEKLKELQQIGKTKTEKGFSYWYSHSTIFGKGRHKNMEALYEKFKGLAPQNSQDDYLANQSLENITQFIKNNTFVY